MEMQSCNYILIPLEPGTLEIFIDLGVLVNELEHPGKRYGQVTYANISGIKGKDPDFQEREYDARGFIRYVVPAGNGVIIGMEPWTSLKQLMFKLRITTSTGIDDQLYILTAPIHAISKAKKMVECIDG